MINTLIIDDSAVARDILRDFLEGDGAFRIIGEAADGKEGVEKILSLNPDLVTLDIEMPGMNGLEVIEAVKQTAVPIVVISGQDTAQTAYEATVRGALEFYSKDIFTASMTPARRDAVYETLKRISGIKRAPRSGPAETAARRPEKRRIGAVLIGASTGGPRALSRLVSMLGADFPVPAALVQHNSPGFDESFAQWLGTYTPLEVKLAGEGEELCPGRIYIARTDRHLALRKTAGNAFRFAYDNGEPENNQKPAVDVLFRTAAEALGNGALSVVLTGMGCDGAAGTRHIRERGGITIAQDEASSLIYGMPRAAVETGCVDLVLSLDRIAPELGALVR